MAKWFGAFFPVSVFLYRYPTLPLLCTFSISLALADTHTHTLTHHTAGISVLLCSFVSFWVLSFAHMHSWSAWCCPHCLTMTTWCTHTHTDEFFACGAVYTQVLTWTCRETQKCTLSQNILKNTLCTGKQSRHVRHRKCENKSSTHTTMQCASVGQTYCLCPACDRESAFCMNYRAALWILSTAHKVCRYCSVK